MEILDSYWFSSVLGPVIGIIRTKNEIGEIKYYIGNGKGEDIYEDAKNIAEHGAKFPSWAGNDIFSEELK